MLKLTFDNNNNAVIDNDEEAITSTTDIVLLNEQNRPTPLAVGLVALELAADVALAVGIYNVMKIFKKRK